MTDPANNPKSKPTWSQVWHLPVLMVGLGLMGVGLYLAKPRYTPPDFNGMLDTVQEYLNAGNTEEASVRLNTMVAAGIDREGHEVRGRYHELLGDHDWLVYSDLYRVPVDTPESNAQLRKVLTAYQTAETDFDHKLDGPSMAWWAEAMVLMKREGEALEIVDRMDAKDADKRYKIIRDLIESHRHDGDMQAFSEMLDRFDRTLRQEKNKQKMLAQRQWIAEIRAKHYLDVGDPQRAIDYINREMQRLRAAGADDAADLLVLLGRAYQAVGDYDNARRLYAVSQKTISDSDPLNAPVLVGLGQIELAVGGAGFENRAQALFTRAAKEHPTGPAFILSLIHI